MLPGNHFDEFSDIDKDPHRLPTAFEGKDQEFRTVNPYDIEGVDLGKYDIENPDRFWHMHNGDKDSWLETASHIPEVQERLNNGETLGTLLQDEKLGRCTNAFFNPDFSEVIRVEEMPGGGYIATNGGRHRIIAARMLGYDIPVKIIGRY